ncbi:MAG: PTS system mannose/fructose/sorbose family transporter subunit IID [Deltaproteobacteria bacterium]|nr:PTS system mannose/fructose/sorbose family transporter subunit IID [Deltaproteobacteria bacterium]
MMNGSTLFGIFLRSLTIQASFNFGRMQNLGFAFAMLPLVRREDGDRTRIAASLERHLQMINTHPYMAAPIIGAVVRIEEEGRIAEAADLKAALMGPYAAIGDSFFWGALRTFSAVAAVIVALSGSIGAPFAFLLLYNPAHLWVRGKGFLEGYRKGKEGIHFIRGLNLPRAAASVRFLSLVLIGILAAIAVDTVSRPGSLLPVVPMPVAASILLALIILGIRRGVSTVQALYGTALLSMVMSI